jgi:hypothetical protein
MNLPAEKKKTQTVFFLRFAGKKNKTIFGFE